MTPDNDKTQTHVTLNSGTMVLRYRIIEKIGAGGMGEVYLAEDTELNRKVALKFLPLHLYQDAVCRARFKREAQATAKLSHPNIVTIFEVSEFNGRPFFAMENVEGQTLREFSKGKDLPLSSIIELAIQICEGLAKAHSAGVVHRDIKPSNILIDRDGRAKIVDFGLASVHGNEQLTKTGTTLGTVGYMSPEQARGEEVDARSDLFSFGVILYEMITGKSPFKADSEIATIKNIIDTIPEPLARYKNSVPDELQRIIGKALIKDKNLRYQHAEDLLADLKYLISTVDLPQSSLRLKRRVLVPLIASLGILAAILVFKPWTFIDKSADKATSGTKKIVVVPFRNQTGDSTLNNLGLMMADWTNQSLLQTGLAEIVPTEVLSGIDPKSGVKSIVSATGAQILVIGSYYRLGDSLQIQAQVVDANEKLLQAIEPVCFPTSEVMNAIGALRQRIMGVLAVVLDERLLGTLTEGSKPPTYEAYQEYMLGFDEFHTRNNWAKAIEHFSRAYTIDTTFFEPLVESTIAYYNLGRLAEEDSLAQFLNIRRTRLALPQILAVDIWRTLLLGNQAKALDDSRKLAKLAPGSHASYGWGYQALHFNRPQEAIEAFKTVNPRIGWAQFWVPYWPMVAAAYHALGDHERELDAAIEGRKQFPTHIRTVNAEIMALAALGRVDEIRKLIEESKSLYSTSAPFLGTPGGTARIAAVELNAHGYKDDAATMYDQSIQWYESRPKDEEKRLRFGLAVTLYNAHHWDKAKNIFKQLEKEFPDNFNYRGYLGQIAARQGDRQTALEVSDWLKNLKTPYLLGGNTFLRARILAILGEKDQAVSLLKEAVLQGYEFDSSIHTDPDFESLWDYPPFIEFIKPKG